MQVWHIEQEYHFKIFPTFSTIIQWPSLCSPLSLDSQSQEHRKLFLSQLGLKIGRRKQVVNHVSSVQGKTSGRFSWSVSVSSEREIKWNYKWSVSLFQSKFLENVPIKKGVREGQRWHEDTLRLRHACFFAITVHHVRMCSQVPQLPWMSLPDASGLGDLTIVLWH